MDTGALVDIAARACVTAGRYLLERVDQPGDVAVKSSPHDVVTEVDAHAEALIRRELLAACPESTVVGEELGGRAGSGICWYVDPLDGTYNFVRGLPMFCVSIGVTVAGAAGGGCVHDPVRDELYSACAGLLRRNGAPVVPRDDRGTIPLVLTDIPGDAGGEPELALFTDLLAAAEVRRIGSSALALAHAELVLPEDLPCTLLSAIRGARPQCATCTRPCLYLYDVADTAPPDTVVCEDCDQRITQQTLAAAAEQANGDGRT